jgi:hypothetical protein
MILGFFYFIFVLKDFEALSKYMKQFPENRFLDAMTNFHLLLFLVTNETIPFDASLFLK